MWNGMGAAESRAPVGKMDLNQRRLLLEKKRAILESQFKQDLTEIKKVRISHGTAFIRLLMMARRAK